MSAEAALHAALHDTHLVIMAAGVLGVLSIFAGLLSRRIGAPVLLAFLAIGMLCGEDGVLGIPFNDFGVAYLIGSVALAVILFAGGLQTPLSMMRLALWPALALATIGVAITTFVVGGCVALAGGVPLIGALIGGAAAAPTDAAAVAVLLPRTGNAVPERVMALLEVESGLNDPMSVFLTFLLLRLLVAPESVTTLHAALSFAEEMGGGLAFGVAAGWLLALALRRLRLEPALAMVFALAAALGVFGAAQVAGTSGFLATYVAGVVTAARAPGVREALHAFFEGMAWLAQIVLFLMLGLLVTPHDLPPHIPNAVVGAAALIFLGRPVAVFACLLPFRYSLREMAFVAWVGLRGAVPIYLSFIPALVDPLRDSRLFAAIFIVVVVSLVVQGWTVGAAARLLGFGPGPRRA